MERRLHEASLSGSVHALNTLMEEDELILDRVSLTCLDETPLHLAALRGHLDFTRALLSRKPKLATELDSVGRTPLHLASAEGHSQIVRELLQVSVDVCRIRDQDGRTPLHLASVKGRVDIIRELIQAQPGSTHDVLDQGETVLHLCVKHNRLDALKLLVESVQKDFLKSQDNSGNTILHLASALKQKETVKYLLSMDGVKEHVNTKNVNGFTALDVLEQCPRDLKGIEIQEVLQQAGGRRVSLVARSPQISSCSQAWQLVWNKYLKMEDHWLEVARGYLIMAATLTATVAFQAGINPPVSVWQELLTRKHYQEAGTNPPESVWQELLTKKHYQEAGTSIFFATVYSIDYYILFLRGNTISLVASLIIIFLMISGFPLKNKFSQWLLTMAMCTALTFMALTYLVALNLLTPDVDAQSDKRLWGVMHDIYQSSIYTWIAALVLLFQTARIMKWPESVKRMWRPKTHQ
uniref:PGG domain-containing protein n=1 Tax=Davidia involucrata TaxID=16924 RepID=A0A5B7C010_DAVIN